MAAAGSPGGSEGRGDKRHFPGDRRRLRRNKITANTGSKSYGVTIRDLVEAGLVAPGAQLVGTNSGVEYSATVTAEGRIRLDHGDEFDAPSPAAMAALDRNSWNGWAWWRIKGSNGTVILSHLREDFVERYRSG